MENYSYRYVPEDDPIPYCVVYRPNEYVAGVIIARCSMKGWAEELADAMNARDSLKRALGVE